MAKIPSIVWIIVGAVMVGVSYRIGKSMDIFFYVGLLFLTIGIFKIIVGFIIGDKKKKADKEAAEMKTHQFTCPRCRTVVASDFRFCPHCGNRIRY